MKRILLEDIAMYFVGLILIAPLWGPVSTYLFFKSWLALVGILACAIAASRGRLPLPRTLACLYHRVTSVLFHGLLLIGGFVILYQWLPFGHSISETMVYWVSSTLALIFFLPAIPAEIDRIWLEANGPEED